MSFATSYPDAHFNNFSWPSLYDPATEVGFLGPSARAGGYYLSDADDVFRFTLYWMLIFHLPFSFVAGAYALVNFAFPPARMRDTETVELPPLGRPHPPHVHARTHSRTGSHTHSSSSRPRSPDLPAPVEWLKPPRLNARRSRWAFSLLVLFVFLVFSLVSAVVGAAVVAFVLVGVYRAAGFFMSTWIPFIWAAILSLIALLEIWPSVIDII